MDAFDHDLAPFAMVPRDILNAVSPRAVVLWCCMGELADDVSGLVLPSMSMISGRLGVSRQTVNKLVRELESTDRLEVVRRSGDSSVYRMTFAKLGGCKENDTPSDAWAKQLVGVLASKRRERFGKDTALTVRARWLENLKRLANSKKLVPPTNPEEIQGVIEWALSRPDVDLRSVPTWDAFRRLRMQYELDLSVS